MDNYTVIQTLLFVVAFFVIARFFPAKKSMQYWAISIVLLGSVAAQIPNIYEIIVKASRISWLLLLLPLLGLARKEIFSTGYFIYFVCSVAAIGMFMLVCSIFSPLHLQSPVFYLLFPPLIAYTVGCGLQKFISEADLKILLIPYFVYAGILTQVLVITGLGDIEDFVYQHSYWYASKNSLARIVGSGVLFFLFVPLKKKWTTYLLRAVSVLFVFFMLLLRSRASLLGMVCAILYFMIKKRQYVKIAILTVVVSLFITTLMYDYREKQISDLSAEQLVVLRSLNLDRYEDVNSFSGGRLELFQRTVSTIKENFLVGVGVCDWSVDNFFLSATVQLGILGLLMVLGLIVYRLFLNLVTLPREFGDDGVVGILGMITIMNFVVSFFEGGGIFGPGNVSLSMWLLSGYFDAKRTAVSLDGNGADGINTGSADEKLVA